MKEAYGSKGDTFVNRLVNYQATIVGLDRAIGVLIQRLKDYGIYGKQFQTVGKNKTEYATVYSTIVIEYNENWDIIPFILSANSLEYDLDVRFLNLIYKKADCKYFMWKRSKSSGKLRLCYSLVKFTRNDLQ